MADDSGKGSKDAKSGGGSGGGKRSTGMGDLGQKAV